MSEKPNAVMIALGGKPKGLGPEKPEDEPEGAESVAELMFDAITSEDKDGFVKAVKMLCEYIKTEDLEQDEEM